MWLHVSKSGAKSWVFRYMFDRKAREMGLGSVATVTLQEARGFAHDQRRNLTRRKDPLAERENSAEAKQKAMKDEAAKQAAEMAAQEAALAKRLTFNQAVDRYMDFKSVEWKNAKHAEQWRNTLATYAVPVIGKLAVADIDTTHIQQILSPIWTTKTETASRLRGRIERVLDWAIASKHREGDNPARWRGHLKELLAAPSKVKKVQHHAAMPYTALPAFMERLRALDSVSGRALQFTVLTAARTGEAIGARWNEIDLAEKVWTIPADRMKANREHRVPLTDQVAAILNKLPREGEFVFPGAKEGKPLSNMAMLELLRGMDDSEGLTVHGFRSSFRDWAAERTNFPRDIAEAALAHTIADKTEAAYRRGDALEKRRRLMQAWTSYCETKSVAATVTPIREATANG